MLRRNRMERNMDESITPDTGTQTPQAIDRAGHTDWERLILGENGITGTIRMVVYALVFVVVFGTLFSFLR
jgi:hypothetical protein